MWASNGDVRVHALVWPSDPQAVGGVPLVMVPGGLGNAWAAEPIAELVALGQLGSRARTVLGFSRRGMGMSSAPAAGYTPRHFASELGAVIAAAGLVRYVLFGHSMGVPVSLEFALGAPRGLTALILGDGPAAYIDFQQAGTFCEPLERHRRYADWDEAFLVAAIKTGDDDADRARFRSLRHRGFRETNDGIEMLYDRAGLVALVNESTAAARTYWEVLPRITQPVLVLKGARGSSPLTEEDLERYERHVRDVRTVRLQTAHDLGISGSPLRDPPDEFAREVGRFLDSIDS